MKKKVILLIAVVLLSTASLVRAEEEQLGVTLDVTYVSSYIWRGVDLLDDKRVNLLRSYLHQQRDGLLVADVTDHHRSAPTDLKGRIAGDAKIPTQSVADCHRSAARI